MTGGSADEVGLSLTYHESGLVEVEARPACSQERVGGTTRRLPTWTPRLPLVDGRDVANRTCV
jgi:hypothetical protein